MRVPLKPRRPVPGPNAERQEKRRLIKNGVRIILRVLRTTTGITLSPTGKERE